MLANSLNNTQPLWRVHYRVEQHQLRPYWRHMVTLIHHWHCLDISKPITTIIIQVLIHQPIVHTYSYRLRRHRLMRYVPMVQVVVLVKVPHSLHLLLCISTTTITTAAAAAVVAATVHPPCTPLTFYACDRNFFFPSWSMSFFSWFSLVSFVCVNPWCSLKLDYLSLSSFLLLPIRRSQSVRCYFACCFGICVPCEFCVCLCVCIPFSINLSNWRIESELLGSGLRSMNRLFSLNVFLSFLILFTEAGNHDLIGLYSTFVFFGFFLSFAFFCFFFVRLSMSPFSRSLSLLNKKQLLSLFQFMRIRWRSSNRTSTKVIISPPSIVSFLWHLHTSIHACTHQWHFSSEWFSSLHRFNSADLERLLHSSYSYPPISITRIYVSRLLSNERVLFFLSAGPLSEASRTVDHHVAYSHSTPLLMCTTIL